MLVLNPFSPTNLRKFKELYRGLMCSLYGSGAIVLLPPQRTAAELHFFCVCILFPLEFSIYEYFVGNELGTNYNTSDSP